MIDLKCKDNKCPICESKMITNFTHRSISKYCENNCYDFMIRDHLSKNGLENSHFNVFDGFFNYGYHDDKEYKLITEEKVRELIEYWKENERYLLRILIDDKIE